MSDLAAGARDGVQEDDERRGGRQLAHSVVYGDSAAVPGPHHLAAEVVPPQPALVVQLLGRVQRQVGPPAVQYSTAQYSTVQYSTVQYSTVAGRR